MASNKDFENPLRELLKPETRITHVKNSSAYACSPLDYGSLIIARITVAQANEKFILEELVYGPVKAEEKVVEHYHKNNQKSKVLFEFGKNVEK